MFKSYVGTLELVKMKTVMPEMKITLDGINGRLTITEEKISELEVILT